MSKNVFFSIGLLRSGGVLCIGCALRLNPLSFVVALVEVSVRVSGGVTGGSIGHTSGGSGGGSAGGLCSWVLTSPGS